MVDNNLAPLRSLTAASVPSLAAFATTLLLYGSSLLAPLDRALHDVSAWLTTRTVQSDLVIVEIDAKSLRELHSWPWPRGYHARVIERLLAAGTDRLFVDIDFSASSDPAQDALLERALRRAAPGQVLLPAFHQPATSHSASELLLVLPDPRFRAHADLVSVNVWPGRDALVRQIPLREPGGDEALRSVAATLNDWRDPALTRLIIDFSIAPDSFPRLSYADVLAGRFDADQVKGRQVAIGATAVELGDLVPVPIYQSLPGVVVQALAYESLNIGMLSRIGVWRVLALCLLVAIGLGLVYARLSWRWGLLAVVLSTAAIFAAHVLLYQGQRTLFDAAPLIVTIVLTYVCHLLARLDQQSFRLWWQNVELMKKDKLITNIVGNSLDAILTLNADGSIASLNPAAEQMFRCSNQAPVGQSIHEFIPQLMDRQNPGLTWNENLVSGQVHELTARTVSGDEFPIDLAMSRMEVEGTPLITAIVRDISVRKQQEAQLRYKATHDSLTDLPNRDLLTARIGDAIRQAPEAHTTLLMLDLDRLKEVNDTLGHNIGDVVLKQVAKRFASVVSEDATLARIGGDEFAVFSRIDRKTSEDLAQRLAASLDKPFFVRGIALRATVSIGVAHYPEHGDNANLLLQHADVAMYVAKRASSVYQIYDAKLDHNTVRRLQLAGKLRSAIESGHLMMHYQPIVHLDARDNFAVEGLLRWQDPEFGLVMPNEFIDLAETSDVIGLLTQWTLDQCLTQCSNWRNSGHNMTVASNLSPRLVQDAQFADTLLQCLERHDVDPAWLTLEITENAIMSDPERALKTAAYINRLGVQLSIDDFGTGYSSFAYLKHLPVHELKIDKSFILDMDKDQEDEFIVNSIITLAHGLGLRIVAEGVETETVFRQLRSIECDLAQGYWISRPCPPSDLPDWRRAWQTRHNSVFGEIPETRVNVGGRS